MEINFEEYLSESERKDIITDVFRNMCADAFKKDAERIFYNAAHKTVLNIVNETFDGKAEELIAEKAKKVINELSAYSVFSRKSHWEKEDSEAFKALNQAIIDNKSMINEKISLIIDGMDKDQLREVIIEQAQEVINDKLFGKAA